VAVLAVVSVAMAAVGAAPAFWLGYPISASFF
jgi:hypothetical protein